jgi:cobalt/nickel transport system permease protein
MKPGDGRPRVLAVVAVLIALAVIRDLRILLVGLALVAPLPLLAGVWHRGWFWQLVILNLVAGLAMVGMILSGQTNAAWLLLGRVNAMALAGWGLLVGLSPQALALALRRLGLGERLPALLALTAHFLGLLGEEVGRLRDNLRARAFQFHLTPHGVRTFGYLAGMLLWRAHERAQRVGEAMRCRGFTGALPNLSQPRANRLDWAVSGWAMLVAVALLAWPGTWS